MAQTEKKRDFKVLAEKIAPDNVLIMAELLAIKETKKLVKFMGQHAIRAHATLCADVFCKDMPDYTLSDNYDIVQSVAAFLCEHYGEYLDDFLYVSKRGKNISTKVECCLTTPCGNRYAVHLIVQPPRCRSRRTERETSRCRRTLPHTR